MHLQFEKYFQESAALPVKEECEVLVVGGGCSGIAAAVAAARQGAKTVLLERNFLLGGDADPAGKHGDRSGGIGKPRTGTPDMEGQLYL